MGGIKGIKWCITERVCVCDREGGRKGCKHLGQGSHPVPHGAPFRIGARASPSPAPTQVALHGALSRCGQTSLTPRPPPRPPTTLFLIYLSSVVVDSVEFCFFLLFSLPMSVIGLVGLLG